jgi:YNFM family putative membrane transporter
LGGLRSRRGAFGLIHRRRATLLLVLIKTRLSNGLSMRPDLRHVAIALAGVSAFLNLYAPQAVLPLLAQEFATGAAQVGLTLTATTLAIALVAPFMGAIADVLGRKRVIAAAMLALTVPTIGVALAPSLEVMIAWRFVQGVLLPPVFAVTITYIGEEWPAAESTGVTGIYFSAASFGGFLGRFLTGVMADWLGWRAAFLLDAGLTFACALGVIVLLRPEQRFVRASNLAVAMRQMLRHLRNRRLVAIYVIGFGVLFNFIAVFTYVNFLLAAPPFNLSAALLGSIFVVYLVASFVTPLTGRAVRRLGRRRFVLIVLAVWGCGLALTLAPSLPMIIAGLAVTAGAGFLSQASATSYVATTAREGASSAVGLYVTFFYIGGSVGAALGGAVWTYAGWPAVVAMAVAMLGLMALIVARVWPPSAQ